jgi:amidase
MIKGNSMGTNWEGYYNTGLLDVFARGRLTRPNDLSETTKLVMLMGQYMEDNYHGRYYAKGQNLSRKLRNAYDAALRNYDVLLMPTLPMKATKIPPHDCSREEVVARGLEMLNNTAPFDASSHPAMTVHDAHRASFR